MLAVTGFGQLQDRPRTAEVGFEAHLVKPVDIGALEGAIEGSLVAS
ncbi:MAG TPA: hypothetical protein VFS67_03995 [Polyangiaceae bacterium]|nr:hypothetical protein [Polyangiaceae bacterium]